MNLQNRFEQYWTPEPNTGCFLWHGALQSDGYGVFQIYPKTLRAHRVAYEMYKGPIPEGLHIDHLCRNPRCVNPAHMEPVTSGENTRRGAAADTTRSRFAAMTHCKHGHPLRGDNLYVSPTTGQRICKECSRARKRKYRAKFPRKGPNLEGLKLGAEASVRARAWRRAESIRRRKERANYSI